MSILKTIIPVLILLGTLQAAVLSLPVLFWRFQQWLNPIEKFLLVVTFLFIVFVLHPLLVIALITFTIGPNLLSLRHTITSRLSAIYTTLTPPGAPARPFLDKSLPSTGREWFMTLLGSYVGWKALGLLQLLLVAGVGLALWGGREENVREGGVSGSRRSKKVGETGVGVRSERTDVQIVG